MLNKYLINIIDQYNFIDIKNLTKDIPKNMNIIYNTSFILNDLLTIEDIIVKCIHRGFKGFTVGKEYDFLIDEIDKKMSKNIIKIKHSGHKYLYSFIEDNRDMWFIDILKLENVIISIDLIIFQ